MKEWKTHCNVSIPALDWRGEIRRDNKTAVAVVNSYRLTYWLTFAATPAVADITRCVLLLCYLSLYTK